MMDGESDTGSSDRLGCLALHNAFIISYIRLISKHQKEVLSVFLVLPLSFFF